MMILSGIKDIEEVMHKIEWSTLLFFAGLFVLMEVSQHSGKWHTFVQKTAKCQLTTVSQLIIHLLSHFYPDGTSLICQTSTLLSYYYKCHVLCTKSVCQV